VLQRHTQVHAFLTRRRLLKQKPTSGPLAELSCRCALSKLLSRDIFATSCVLVGLLQRSHHPLRLSFSHSGVNREL
jgi:hypothetical protein